MTNTGQMSAIQKKWNKERYKEDVSVLPEGQLTKAKKMKRTDKEALKVNISKKNSYYLKGFVGTTYAVSYTHLDVYKRQLQHRQKGMKTAPIPEVRPVRESSLRNIV